MAVQVVDRNERQAARPGQGLCRRDPDEQSADEAACVTATFHVVERGVGFVERRLHSRQ